MKDGLLDSVVFVSPGQVACTVGDEVMILNLNDGVYYGLDPVGTRIWELLQVPISVHEVRDALLQEFDVDPDRCQRDLLRLVEDLIEARLVEVAPVEAR
jgi:hypothetical protein